MSAYGRQGWVSQMAQEPPDVEGMRSLAKDVWHQRGKIYIDPDDPELPEMHRAFAIQIAEARYGRRKCRQ